MASSAASPRLPSAARWNVSSVSRKQRDTEALYRSFFDPNRRKMYGWEMPARLAISSVEAAWSPRSANSTTAASRISSRRSSALFRSWGVVTMTSPRLVTTYKLVKGLGDAVEIGLGEAGVEGQNQGALVSPVGAGERALIAICA